MVRVFIAEGVFFTGRGVEIKDDIVEVLEGKDSYVIVLDHARKVLSSDATPEILFHCAKEDDLVPEALEREMSMRDAGFKIRKTISYSAPANKDYADDYRLIPDDYTETCRMKTIVYKNYVVQDLGDSLMRIRSNRLAGVFRSQFEYWWQKGEKIRS